MIKTLLSLMIVTITSSVFAIDPGGTDGGGGRGVVCYADVAQRVISSVELLDFYEGRMLEGYSIPEQNLDYKTIYKEISKKAASRFINQIMNNGDTILKGFKFLPTGVRLNKVDDSSEIFIPGNCKIEQLANFQGISRIFIVKDFWDLMSETSKAGLLAHELIWFVERNAGAENSARARRTVARFFADNYEFAKIIRKPKVGDLRCSAANLRHHTNGITSGNSFLVSKIPDTENCELNFDFINGAPTFTEQKANVEYCADFLFDTGRPVTQDDQELTGTFEVNSTNDGVLSHHLTIQIDLEKDAEGKLVRRSMLKAVNREFPGYEENMSQLYCYPLTEEDISAVDWD